MSPISKSETLGASFSNLTAVKAKSWIGVQKLIVCTEDQQSKNKNKKEHNKNLLKKGPGFLGGSTSHVSQCRSMFGEKGVAGFYDGVQKCSIQIQGGNSSVPSTLVRQLLER